MDYTSINIKGKVSRIGLGTWSIGGSLWGGTDESLAIKTIHKALENGITLIDTAPAYGNGASEKIVGKALKEYGHRDQIILATKSGLNIETSNVFRDSSRRYILKEVDESLQRLQVDYIDLYQIHWPDPTTSLLETAETYNELLKMGKIKAIGVSNFSVDQMNEFQKIAPIHSAQFPFNIFEREAEHHLLGYCLGENITTLGYSPLCRSLLSGKMSKNRVFKEDDLRKGMDPKFQEPLFSEYLQCAKALESWSKAKFNRSLAVLAIRWVLDSDVNIALWGARKPEQLDDLASVFGWELTDSDFKEIDQIVKENVINPVEPTFMAPPTRKDES